MRLAALSVMAVVMTAGCAQPTTPNASTASEARASTSPVVTPPSCKAPASTYGLLFSWGRDAAQPGRLEMVAPSGCVGASAPVAASSAPRCDSGAAAFLPPPVSATKTKVYFRDGDTKIRYLTPTGEVGDVTTVPGGPTVVSSFSVSIDDQRIAVVVLDFSNPPTVSLQLYVEDLVGGGHHTVIFTNTVDSYKKNQFNLWPRGWHAGDLVLAVVMTCVFEPVPNPAAWHIVDAGTAMRKVSVGTDACSPGWWPSPAGLACFDYKSSQTNLYDWSGRITATVATNPESRQAVLSPSGAVFSTVAGGGLGDPSPVTSVYKATGGSPATFPGAMACLWIDETAMLAQGAVIQYPSGVIVSETSTGQCAGRFPGGL